jgi:hypothetical protein
METNDERRLRKLKELCSAKGGHVSVAQTAGLKPVYLDQIIKGVTLPPKKGDGSRSERALGNTAARAIEEAYQLGHGWFDNDGDDVDMNPKELELVALFRQLGDPVLQDLHLEKIRDSVAQRNQLLENARERTPSKFAPAKGKAHQR